MALPTKTLSGETLTVLTLESDTSSAKWQRMTLTPEFSTEVTTAISGFEHRRRNRFSIKWSAFVEYFMTSTSATDLREFLADMIGTRVLFPVWPLIRQKSDWGNRTFDPQLIYNLTTGALHESGDVSSASSSDYLVPVLAGMVERPEIPPETDSDEALARVGLNFTEDRDYSWRMDVVDSGDSVANFPTLDNYVVETDRSKDGVRKISLGGGIKSTFEGVQTVSKWGQAASLTADEELANKILSHFSKTFGRWKAFSVPAWYQPNSSPTANAPHTLTARYASDRIEMEFHDDSEIIRMKVDLWELPWEYSLPSGETSEKDSLSYLYEWRYEIPAHAGGPLYTRETDWESDLTRTNSFTSEQIEHDTIQIGTEFKPSRTTIRRAWDTDHPLATLWKGDGEGALKLTITEVDPNDPGGDATVLLSEYVADVEVDDHEITAKIGDTDFPDLPRIEVSRYDNRNPLELWQIRFAEVSSFSGGNTLIRLSWEDLFWDETPDDFFDDWYIEVMEGTDLGLRKAITGWAESNLQVTVGTAFPNLGTGEKVAIMSPYIRRGTVIQIDDSGTVDETIHIDFDDSLGNPSTKHFAGGSIETGSGTSFRSILVMTSVNEGGTPADHRVTLKKPFGSDILVSDQVRIFPGYDSTYSTAGSKFPLIQPNFQGAPTLAVVNPARNKEDPVRHNPAGGKK